jgi:hypothetical protein
MRNQSIVRQRKEAIVNQRRQLSCDECDRSLPGTGRHSCADAFWMGANWRSPLPLHLLPNTYCPLCKPLTCKQYQQVLIWNKYCQRLAILPMQSCVSECICRTKGQRKSGKKCPVPSHPAAQDNIYFIS